MSEEYEPRLPPTVEEWEALQKKLAIATAALKEITGSACFLAHKGGRLGIATRALKEIADDHGIPWRQVYEADARRHFLGTVPRKSADIKKALVAGCRQRNWPVCDAHAADALCCADYARTLLEPEKSHANTPLFANTGWRMRKKQGADRSAP